MASENKEEEKKEKKTRRASKKKEEERPAVAEAVPVAETPAEPAGPEQESASEQAGGESKKGGSDEFSLEDAPEIWVPKTALGHRVYSGEINSIKEIVRIGVPIKEVGIIDKLLPGMKEEVVDVGRVQRVTDSGRRMRFRVVAVVGNEDGYIGIGEAKAKEVGPAIRKAIDKAKLSVCEIKRGCGSLECSCGTPHTVPMKISGKAGSVSIIISPAPKGVGLSSGEIVKKILGLAGIKDAWVKTSGHTRTGINFAHAVYNALVNTNAIKISDEKSSRFKIVSGLKH